MREDVRDHESSEYDARNSVGRHEGQVDFGDIAWGNKELFNDQ